MSEHDPRDVAIAKAVFARVYGEGYFDPSVLPESSLIEAARMARMGEVPVDPLVLEVRSDCYQQRSLKEVERIKAENLQAALTKAEAERDKARAALEHVANHIQHARELGGHWSDNQKQAFLNGAEQVARETLKRRAALSKGEG